MIKYLPLSNEIDVDNDIDLRQPDIWEISSMTLYVLALTDSAASKLVDNQL